MPKICRTCSAFSSSMTACPPLISVTDHAPLPPSPFCSLSLRERARVRVLVRVLMLSQSSRHISQLYHPLVPAPVPAYLAVSYAHQQPPGARERARTTADRASDQQT